MATSPGARISLLNTLNALHDKVNIVDVAKYDEFCTEHHGFSLKIMNFALKSWILR